MNKFEWDSGDDVEAAISQHAENNKITVNNKQDRKVEG